MKRKELYEFIREEIINELTETTYAGKGAVEKITKDSKFNTLNTDAKTNAIKNLNAGGDVELEESELEEMARIPNKIRLGDDAKITLAKELYGPETIEGRLIAAIEGSEDGLTQKELGAELRITIDSKLNPYIEKLVFAQVLAKPAKTATAEPEPTVEPEDDDADVEVQDDYEKPEEEESVPEEPKSKEEIEKDKLAQAFKNLSDEETKKFNGFLTSVKKNKDDKAKIDAILKLAKDKKFSPTLMNFLFNAAGRDSLKNI